MATLATVVGVGMVLLAVPSMVLAMWGWRNRGKPGARGYVLAAVGIGGWSATVGLAIALDQLGAIRLIKDLQLQLVNLTAVGWVLLVIEYRRRRTVDVTSLRILALLVIPVLTAVFVATNDLHHLIWESPVALDANGRFQTEYGPWFGVHTVYVIGLHVAGAVALARDAITAGGVHRRQVGWLLAAWVVGFGSGVASFLIQALSLLPVYVDPAPVGFLLASALWAGTLFRYQLFRIVPVGREAAVETIPDTIVSIDADGVVADANPAARVLFSDDAVGTPAEELFAEFPTIREQFAGGTTRNVEVSATVDGARRHYSVSITSIDFGGGQSGSVVVLRDITPVKQSEEDLDLLRQVLTRVLRHNIRNSLSVIQNRAGSLEADVAGASGSKDVQTIRREAEELADISTKAKTIATIVDRDETSNHDLSRVLDDVVTDMEGRFPDAAIDVDVQGEWSVLASGGLEAAIGNLIENGIEHNDGDRPRVEVSVRPVDRDTVELRVTDNGPGVPEHELDVLRAGSETDLEHGSGVGLWLVKWVVDHSGGDVEFETGPTGTTAVVRLQSAA